MPCLEVGANVHDVHSLAGLGQAPAPVTRIPA